MWDPQIHNRDCFHNIVTMSVVIDLRTFESPERKSMLRLSNTIYEGLHRRSLQASNGSNSGNSDGTPVIVFFFVMITIFLFLCFAFRICRILSTPPSGVEGQQSTSSPAVAVGSTLPRQQQPQQNSNQQLADAAVSSTALNPQEIEQQLVTRHYSEQDSAHKDCAICLSSFQKGEEVAGSVNQECHHLFHTQCIVTWLMSHQGCPECRRTFITPV